MQNLIKTRIPTGICTCTYNFVRITTNDKSANIGIFFFLINLDFVMVFVVLMVHLIHAQTGGMCIFLTICVCHTFVLLYNRIGEIMTYQTQIWTPVRRIFSLVVYQLSYLVPVSYIFWTLDILNPGSIFRGINILYDTSNRTELNAAVWIK